MLNVDVISLVESKSECLSEILSNLANVPSMAIGYPVVDYVTRIKEDDGTMVKDNSGHKLPLDGFNVVLIETPRNGMEKNINQ